MIFVHGNSCSQKTALRAARQKEPFIRAEKYALYYWQAAKEEVRLARLAKADKAARVPAQSKVAFVIRIKG